MSDPREARRRRWGRRLRWALLGLAALGLLGLAWLNLSRDAKIVGLRNVLSYRLVRALGGPQVQRAEPPGAVAGTVRDGAGRPIAGAVVVVASAVGDAFSAETDADGRYRIDGVLPGPAVPIAGKRGYGDVVSQRCAAGLCRKRRVTVRPGATSQGVDFVLPEAAPAAIQAGASLVVSPTSEVETTAPFQGKARRTNFSFERDGLRVNDCWLYEPVEGDGPFPTLLLVLPGPVLGWEIVPVPFAAQGYSVLACYPLRGTNIDADAEDLLAALETLRQGGVASRADTQQLGLIAASFTSLHAYRLLGLTDEVKVALILGGLADGYAFRHDTEMGTAHARPPFDLVLLGLGFPNRSPELYFKFSSIYHLEGLPPLCLLHGRDDELVPFNQSVMLDAEMSRRGLPHEFYAYDGLKHYFSTSADNATTQQMMQDSLDCLRRGLASR